MIKTITNEEEFEKVIKKNKVVVDFYAKWCGPCRMLSPIIEEVALENEDITFIKIDIDENETLPRKYNVMSIPTILIFENGELLKQKTGYMDKEELSEYIKK